jgi:hypothetical protein
VTIVIFQRCSKLLCVTLLLFVVSAVEAAPTVNVNNRDIVCPAVSPRSCADAYVVCELEEITEHSQSGLAAVAAEFRRPPASLTASATHTKTLPAVPGTVFLVLTGFLCVSLVKDRGFWLSALAGLLWVGQTGIQAIPQLALRLSPGKHVGQQLSAELTYPYYLENSSRLRSDIEGTRYIGLLHHLAGIPRADSASSSTPMPGTSVCRQHLQKMFGQILSCPREDGLAYPSAIIPERYSLSSLLNRLVTKARQFKCFSPAFIFDNLPRGPPELTWDVFFKASA